MCSEVSTRRELAIDLLVHWPLNEDYDDSTAMFVVDMMQNEPLPELSIGDAFDDFYRFGRV